MESYFRLFQIITTVWLPLLPLFPLGLWNPHVLGGGGEMILELLQENHTVQFLAFLFILRLFYSMLSYGTGLPGGIFLPILSLGALLGLVYAEVLIQFFGVDPSLRVSFVFFAMAGYFSANWESSINSLVTCNGNGWRIKPINAAGNLYVNSLYCS